MKYAIPANEGTIDLIQSEYQRSNAPWIIGFSGGKDSSAVLMLTFLAAMKCKTPQREIYIVYCDTGVDIPIINDLVTKTLSNIQIEAKEKRIPLSVRVVSPPVKDKYFAKVIGNGYPPPTNIFRWCTDRLRINPVKAFLDSLGGQERVILLGIRKSESVHRDNVISQYETGKQYYYRQEGSLSTTRIFAPIIDYSTEDVWATLAYNPVPYSIDAPKLMALYKQASGECPLIRDPKGTPCGSGRFGCWTCTVVRKDKSITSLVGEGYTQLEPLLDFRNWLFVVRDDLSYRLSKRRNGTNGPGPFTLEARKEILAKLIEAQRLSGYTLIDQPQLDYIDEYWRNETCVGG